LTSADRRRWNKISNKAVHGPTSRGTYFHIDGLRGNYREKRVFSVRQVRGKLRQTEREREREKPQARNFVLAALERRVGTSCENYPSFVDAGSGDCRWHTISLTCRFSPSLPRRPFGASLRGRWGAQLRILGIGNPETANRRRRINRTSGHPPIGLGYHLGFSNSPVSSGRLEPAWEFRRS